MSKQFESGWKGLIEQKLGGRTVVWAVLLAVLQMACVNVAQPSFVESHDSLIAPPGQTEIVQVSAIKANDQSRPDASYSGLQMAGVQYYDSTTGKWVDRAPAPKNSYGPVTIGDAIIGTEGGVVNSMWKAVAAPIVDQMLKASGNTNLNPAQQKIVDGFLNPYVIDQSNPIQRGFAISGEGAGMAIASVGGTRLSAGGPKSYSMSAGAVYKAPQNWKQIKSYTPRYDYRVPDRLIMDGRNPLGIGELKNVQKQSLTSQIRDYARYAEEKGIPFYLFINKSARLTKPLQAFAKAGKVRIIRN